MRKILLIVLGLILTVNVFAKGGHGGRGGHHGHSSYSGHTTHVHVNGHFRKDGTYVSPHFRTAPDATKTNNWSHVGNVNPYTGKVGTNTDTSPNYRNVGGHISNGYVNSNQGPVSVQHLVDRGHYVIRSDEIHNTKTGAQYLALQ